MVYLVSDSLPCFMKVNGSNGIYSEKLNELMEYSLVVLAETDGKWHYAQTPTVVPGTVNVTLQYIDEVSLRELLNAGNTKDGGNDFGAEMSYMKETRKFNVRKIKEAEQVRIDQEIMQVIFPCSFDFAREDVAVAMLSAIK